MADLGAIAKTRDLVFFMPVYHFIADGLPHPARIVVPYLFKVTGIPDYPEFYWRRELVLGDSRGPLYMPAGADALFRPFDVTTTPRDPDGWQWCQPGVSWFRYQCKAGDNTVTVTVKHNRPQEPTPQIQIMANPALGVLEGIAAASTAPGVFQNLSIQFSATAGGFVTLALGWDLRSPGQRCVWKDFTLQP